MTFKPKRSILAFFFSSSASLLIGPDVPNLSALAWRFYSSSPALAGSGLSPNLTALAWIFCSYSDLEIGLVEIT